MGDRLRKVHAYSCNPRIQLQRLENETNSFRQDPYLPIFFNSRAEEKASIQMKGLGRILLSMEEKASCNFIKPRLPFLSKMAFIFFTNSGEASHSAYSISSFCEAYLFFG